MRDTNIYTSKLPCRINLFCTISIVFEALNLPKHNFMLTEEGRPGTRRQGELARGEVSPHKL